MGYPLQAVHRLAPSHELARGSHNSPGMNTAEIEAWRRRGRTNVLATFEARPKSFSIGWCAAFVQWHTIYVVQRAQVRP